MVLSLLLGAGVFLVSLVCFAMTTTLIVNLGLRLIRTALGFWKSVAIMMIVSLVTAAAHLIPAALLDTRRLRAGVAGVLAHRSAD